MASSSQGRALGRRSTTAERPKFFADCTFDKWHILRKMPWNQGGGVFIGLQNILDIDFPAAI